ncbi:hypothetical protein [Robbsia sp. KACC 23696]|uniref:hypothetical protein n=1 Tax=Robbsia sp. KACC 23696 TaxID=3149231 RepID=UPI00325AFF8C
MMSNTRTRQSDLGMHRKVDSHEHRLRRVEDILPTLATKSDLNELGLMTKADINELRLATKADLSEFRLATKAEINELRLATQADIKELSQSTKADIKELSQSTKADINELSQSTKAELNEFSHSTKAEINELRLSTKAEFVELRLSVDAGFERVFKQMHKMDASAKTWMLGTMIGIFVGFGGLFLAMNNNGKRESLATTSQAIAHHAPALDAPSFS